MTGFGYLKRPQRRLNRSCCSLGDKFKFIGASILSRWLLVSVSLMLLFQMGCASPQNKDDAFVEATVISRRDMRALESRSEFEKRILSASRGHVGLSVVSWSCGFVCADFALVDTLNNAAGSIHFAPFSVSQCQDLPDKRLIIYSRLSRVITMNGSLEQHTTAGREPDYPCGKHHYQWTGRTLVRLK